MSMFPELRRHGPKELPRFFMNGRVPDLPDEDRELWLQELALEIAKTGARGVDFLLSCAPDAEECLEVRRANHLLQRGR